MPHSSSASISLRHVRHLARRYGLPGADRRDGLSRRLRSAGSAPGASLSPPAHELQDRPKPRGLLLSAGLVQKLIVSLSDQLVKLSAKVGKLGLRNPQERLRLVPCSRPLKRGDQMGQAEER